jgi:hypothetical protein
VDLPASSRRFSRREIGRPSRIVNGYGWGKPPVWRYNAHTADLPFPRGKRAEAVWASGACWSDCGAYCAWGLAGCLKEDTQGRCLKYTDKCDRYCQRECRTRGGPFLSVEFPWE